MQYQKIINLMGKTIDSTKLPKYGTRKWIEIFYQSKKIKYNSTKIQSTKIKTLDLKHRN